MTRPLCVAILLSGGMAANAQVPEAPGFEPLPSPATPTKSNAGFQVLETRPNRLDVAAASGVPRGVTPVVIDLRQAYRLALVASRSPRPGTKTERAAMLDPAKLADAADRGGVEDFTRFRREWLAAAVASEGGVFDPAAGYLDLLTRLQSVETAWRASLANERLLSLFKVYVEGSESSGISRLQVGEVAGRLREAQRVRLDRELEYRDALDAFKVRLGLPPDAPVVPDRSAFDGFSKIFYDLERWVDNEERDAEKLTTILRALPQPPDLAFEGISARAASTDDAKLDALMAAAARVAKDDAGAARGRRAIRHLVRQYRDVEIAAGQLDLAMQRRSQITDQIMAPPASIDAGANAAGQAISTVKLLDAIAAVLAAEDRVVASWSGAQARRLDAYRALGILPFRGWDDFLATFTTKTTGK